MIRLVSHFPFQAKRKGGQILFKELKASKARAGGLNRSHRQLATVAPTLIRQQRPPHNNKVLLLDDILLAKDDAQRLRQTANVIRSSAKSRQEFIKEVNELQPLAIYRHLGAARSVTVTGPIDADLVNKMPKSLQFICNNGAGCDSLDIPSLTAREIQVSNVPRLVDDATATTALWLLIGTLRHFKLAMRHLEKGSFNAQFPFAQALCPGRRDAQTLGIIGAGGIGQALAQKAACALGMRIIYHNRRRLAPEQERAMTVGSVPDVGPAVFCASLESLLRTSDAVSVHCPFTSETRHLLGARQFDMMKRTAVLINTARGHVVDEHALAKALQAEKIAGVGLDVFEQEPNVHPTLHAHDRTLLLPHIGTLTHGTQQEMEKACLDNIMHGLEHGKLAFWVPEQRGKF